MAQRVQVQLIDDLNGLAAQETVRFGLDGTKYEIDLTADNAVELRAALTHYADRGRKTVGSSQGLSTQSGPSVTRKREELQRIREWARSNGHDPRPRGRVPRSILDAYTDAHK